MLRIDLKEIFILFIFCLLLHEFMTYMTFGMVIAGGVLVFLKIKPRRIYRNIMALIIFGSYWFTYGKLIDPEVGLNFLTTIIVLKVMERENFRDRYMIFFGLLLVISAGSLFERSLSYVFFFSASFFLLIRDFYAHLNLKWGFKDLKSAFLWVLPFTVIFFFVVPRILNPIPFQKGKEEGEVGYTPEVNMSQIGKLVSNGKAVFQASVSRPLAQDVLYWRGNTIAFTDGWNWKLMPSDRPQGDYAFGEVSSDPRLIRQEMRLFFQDEFYFTLDHPLSLKSGKDYYRMQAMHTLPQSRWRWAPRYEVISLPGQGFMNSEDSGRYLKLSLSKEEKQWIHENFKAHTLKNLEQEVKSHFQTEKFSYSLEPGIITSFNEFVQEKKIGFCSHYASALALILRTKGIPTRLVSGFMGGQFNRYANFYVISQNDAHVWVEAIEDGKWVRLDPTGWIVPDRVRLGGEAFMEKLSAKSLSLGDKFWRGKGWVKDVRQWFAQWDYNFYRFLEQMDYHTQNALLEKIKLSREWLLTIGLLLLVSFMGLYLWWLTYMNKGQRGELDELWILFASKLKKKGVLIDMISLNEILSKLNGWNHPDKLKFITIMKELMESSFSKGEYDYQKLKERLKRL